MRWSRPFALVVAVVLAGAGSSGRVSAQTAPASSACSAGSSEVRGLVRRLDGAPVAAGLPVSVGWNVLLLQGLSVRTERCERSTVTDEGGTFRVTGVPQDEALVLVAAGLAGEVGVALRHDASGSATQPLQVYLPAASDVEAAGPVGAGKACRTRGRVVNAGGAAVGNARVRVAGSDVVRTDAQGGFDAPACGTNGTSFDIRGLNVARGEWWVSVSPAPTYWAVSLDRPLPRLDAVVVTAPRRDFTDVTGFEQRRRSGWGRFVTRADIESRMPQRVQFMLEGMPGVRVIADGTVRMTRAANLACSASVWVDGMYLQAFDLSMIDPTTVYGIEVYRGGNETPPQFQSPTRGACGAVLVWTKRGLDLPGGG
jgi:hypothetical protein